MSHVSECDITTFGQLAAIARVHCNNTEPAGFCAEHRDITTSVLKHIYTEAEGEPGGGGVKRKWHEVCLV